MTTPSRITSQTSVPEIVRLLSQSGCPDITTHLDLSQCSQWAIGGGGQGDIYSGVLTNGDRVAIKIARGDQSQDPSKGHLSFKRAARELHTWFTLDHENIANLFGMAVFRDRVAMVSPWIDPGDFYKFIRRFPGADRMGLCIQVADGLAYLHQQGVVHGDLKANNVLIGLDGVVKLIDFGLSVLAQSNIHFSTTQNPGGGSIRWMAPELFEASSARSCEADVYALAMTFIEILTDKVPFSELEDFRVIHAVTLKHEIPDRPQRLEEGVLRHNHWWSLLKKSWDRDRNMRPKASHWNLLDQAVVTERIKALNQFKEALRYGYTRDGLLKNMDTGEVLAFADQGPTFLVRETIGSVQMSVETSVQVLVDYYSRTITLDPLNRAYGKALQDAIQEGLNERIRQVWRWAVVNTSRLPPRNQGMISRFFSTLNAFALAMTTQVRLCLADCSACDRACLRLYNHLEDTHLCIDHQHVDHVHYATHKHTEQGSYGSTNNVKPHPCGQMCHLSRRGNCRQFCVRIPFHDESHICAVSLHRCGKPCSSPIWNIPDSGHPNLFRPCPNACNDVYNELHPIHLCEDCDGPFRGLLEPVWLSSSSVINPNFKSTSPRVWPDDFRVELRIPELCKIWTFLSTSDYWTDQVIWPQGGTIHGRHAYLLIRIIRLGRGRELGELRHLWLRLERCLTISPTRNSLFSFTSWSSIERPVDDIATISPMKAELVSEDTALEVDSCQASLRLGHQITLTYLRNVLAIIQEESLSHDHVDDAAASHFFAAVVFEVLASKRGATWEQSGQVDRSRVEVKDSPAQYKRIMDRVAILNAQADISVL